MEGSVHLDIIAREANSKETLSGCLENQDPVGHRAKELIMVRKILHSAFKPLRSRDFIPTGIIGTVIVIMGLGLASCGQDELHSEAKFQQFDTVPVDPSLKTNSGEKFTSESAYWPLWQCNAYPLNGMPFVYWIHSSPFVAATSAMNVCWYTYHVPCNYRCFRIR
jgi:hypothetical protein